MGALHFFSVSILICSNVYTLPYFYSSCLLLFVHFSFFWLFLFLLQWPEIGKTLLSPQVCGHAQSTVCYPCCCCCCYCCLVVLYLLFFYLCFIMSFFWQLYDIWMIMWIFLFTLYCWFDSFMKFDWWCIGTNSFCNCTFYSRLDSLLTTGR